MSKWTRPHNRAICYGDKRYITPTKKDTKSRRKFDKKLSSIRNWQDSTLEKARKAGRGSIEFQHTILEEMYARGLLICGIKKSD